MKIGVSNHAEKCPVCKGKGKLSNENDVCHGCDGKGWITVENPPVPIYEDIVR